MQLSIIPEIILAKKIKFLNELDMPIELYEDKNNLAFSNFIFPFDMPYLIIDTFAKKTTIKENIVTIDLDELKKLDYIIIVVKTNKGWFSGQKVIYLIQKKTAIRLPGSRKIDYVPKDHRLQKDIPNKRVRIIGPNTGATSMGPWNDIK